MVKHCIIAFYLFSVFYCYIGLTAAVDSALTIFRERHKCIDIDEGSFLDRLKLHMYIMALSAIPVFNFVVGVICDGASEQTVNSAVAEVELKHREEIAKA